MMVELVYGMSGVMSLVARSRRPLPLAEVADDNQRFFNPSEVITLLLVSDEDAATLQASVTSHYAATRTLNLPFKARCSLTLLHTVSRGSHAREDSHCRPCCMIISSRQRCAACPPGAR